MVLSASIVFQALASLRREINYKAFLQGAMCPSVVYYSLANSQTGYRMVAVSSERVSQTRLYKSVSPVIKWKYTLASYKWRTMASIKWKIFELYSDLLFLDFPTRRRIHISHFLDFSFPIFLLLATPPTSRVTEMNLPSGHSGGAPFSLCNTLSSDISCEKLSQIIRVFFVFITLVYGWLFYF